MATGVLVAGGMVVGVPGAAASAIPAGPISGVAPSGTAGTLTPVLIDMLGQPREGAATHEFVDDYYNRVHVVPPNHSFGTITSSAQTQSTVWNAYLHQPKSVAGVSVPSGAGIEVTGPSGVVELPPLGVVTYGIVANRDGAAAFDGSVTYTVDGVTYTVRVSGVRARVWPAAPNWADSYSVTYSFKTEIQTSRSGREQRMALRRTPRKTLEYRATVKLAEAQILKRSLWGRQPLSFVAAEEPRYTTLAANVLAGALSFPVADTPDWLVEGCMIVLVSGAQREMLTVDSVAEGVVTTTDFASMHWPEGTRVHYGLAGYVASSLQSTRPTSSSMGLSVVFNGTPTAAAFEAMPDAAFTRFDGVPVFLKKPNWSETPSVSAEHDVTEVDFDRGAVARFVPVAFGRELRQATYVGRDFATADTIRKTFFRCRGRLKPVWVPTWEFDIALREAVPGGSAALAVDGHSFHEAYGESTVHKALFVKWADGEVGYRRIAAIAATTSPGGAPITTITLASAFARPVTPADMVGWLYLCRFASDDLTIEWVTRTVAQAQIQFVTVEVEPNLADLS